MARPMPRRKLSEVIKEFEPEKKQQPAEQIEEIEEAVNDEIDNNVEAEVQCCGKCQNMKPQINSEAAIEIIARHFADYEKFLSCLQDIVVYRRKVKEYANMALEEINERYKETISLTGDEN